MERCNSYLPARRPGTLALRQQARTENIIFTLRLKHQRYSLPCLGSGLVFESSPGVATEDFPPKEGSAPLVAKFSVIGTFMGHAGWGNEELCESLAVYMPSGDVVPAYRFARESANSNICQDFRYLVIRAA